MVRSRFHRSFLIRTRGAADAVYFSIALCGMPLLMTGCASATSSRAFEVAGYPITMASDAACSAAQNRDGGISPARDLPPLFALHSMTKDMYYPPKARERQEQGSVDLEFSIDAWGRPIHIRQVCSAEPGLRVSALLTLNALHFLVPDNWAQSGGRKRSFVMEFEYRMTTGARTCKGLFTEPRIPGAKLARICLSDQES